MEKSKFGQTSVSGSARTVRSSGFPSIIGGEIVILLSRVLRMLPMLVWWVCVEEMMMIRVARGF